MQAGKTGRRIPPDTHYEPQGASPRFAGQPWASARLPRFSTGWGSGRRRNTWCELVGNFGRLFHNLAGCPAVVDQVCSLRTHHRYHLSRRAPLSARVLSISDMALAGANK